MTNEIQVLIRGSQRYKDEREEAPIELVTEGKYVVMGGKQHIRYDEVLGGTTEKTRNHVIIDQNAVEVRKLGEAEVIMYFRKGERCRMSYKTRFGILPIEIKTTELFIKQGNDRIDVEIAYTTYHGNEKIADCSMKMQFQNK